MVVAHLSSEQSGPSWQFVTNHTQVLLCIARDPEIRLRDIADDVGITLGSAQRILADLVQAGYVKRERQGRRNRYLITATRRCSATPPRTVTTSGGCSTCSA